MLFNAIDIGASFIKRATVSPLTGDVRDYAQVPFPKTGRIHDILTEIQSLLNPGHELVVCSQIGGKVCGTRFVSWMESPEEGGTPFESVIAEQLRLKHPVLVDREAAIDGADLKPGEILVNVGTGSQVSNGAKTVCYLPGGRMLNAIVSDFSKPLPWGVAECMAGNYYGVAKDLMPDGFHTVKLSGGIAEKSAQLRDAIARRFGMDPVLIEYATMKGLLKYARRISYER